MTTAILLGPFSRARRTTPIWNQGSGEGQIIGVIDSVIDINQCFFRTPRIIPSVQHRKGGASQLLRVGCWRPWHFVAGIAAGDDFNNPGAAANRGMAWAARFTFGNNADVPGDSSLLAYLLSAAAADGAAIHATAGTRPDPQYNQTAARRRHVRLEQ